MPDPRAAKRLLSVGCNIKFKKTEIKVPVEIKDPGDYKPGTHFPKMTTRKVWLVSIEMPKELKEVLNTDMEADKVFHSLTAGNQRSLIYLISQVKSSDKRIERALKMAEQIKNGITSARAILK
jgi:hypothetical protein